MKLNKIINLFTGKHYRYVIIGIFIFAINFMIMSFLSQLELFQSSLLHLNLANILSLEITLIISYLLHKRITWLGKWDNFFSKLIQLHKALSVSLIFRILIFFLLSYFRISWQVALVVSILATSWINFGEIDQFVFSTPTQITMNTLSYSQAGEGTNTLETLEEAILYNEWIASKIEDYLGEKNLELGAGMGTIANIILRNYCLELVELSEHNQKILKARFKNSKNISKISGDILQNQNWNYYNCIYSSNVLEHIPNDEEIILHCFKLLTQGGYFVAIVPAMKILYSEFDKKIGHFRRYNRSDVRRITNKLEGEGFSVKVIDKSFFNPIGALGWFLKMKLLRKQRIDPKDAMLMNSIVPFVAWLDYLPLGFGQSMLIVLKKIN